MKPIQYRLAQYKKLKAQYGAEYIKSLRSSNPVPLEERKENQPFELHGSKVEWVEECSLRFVGYAGDTGRNAHTGWYCDSFQDGKTRGVVFRLPSRSSNPEQDEDKGEFVAGCTDPWQWNGKKDSGPFIMELCIYDSLRDAMYSADMLAGNHAEDCREDDAKQQAEQQIEDTKAEIESARQACAEEIILGSP